MHFTAFYTNFAGGLWRTRFPPMTTRFIPHFYAFLLLCFRFLQCFDRVLVIDTRTSKAPNPSG